MALAKMTFDELNALVGYKVSEPIDEYYEPMRITKEQKEKRMDLAYDLEVVVTGLLLQAFYADQYGIVLPLSDVRQQVRTEYVQAVEGYFPVDETLSNHIDGVLIGAMEVLYRHSDEPFYYSKDRARAIAENDSNALWAYEELGEAFDDGYMFKTWMTIMDGRERGSHAEVNQVTIPISEPFELQGGYMMFPGDDSLGVSDEELINCRCSLSFS